MGLDAFFGGTVKKSTKKSTAKVNTKKSMKKSSASKKSSVKNESKQELEVEGLENFDDDEDKPLKTKRGESGIQTTMSSKKKNLECKNKKCGYKKTLFKTSLKPEDLICVKCGGEMVQK